MAAKTRLFALRWMLYEKLLPGFARILKPHDRKSTFFRAPGTAL
jgi:hypothetical protein